MPCSEALWGSPCWVTRAPKEHACIRATHQKPCWSSVLTLSHHQLPPRVSSQVDPGLKTFPEKPFLLLCCSQTCGHQVNTLPLLSRWVRQTQVITSIQRLYQKMHVTQTLSKQKNHCIRALLHFINKVNNLKINGTEWSMSSNEQRAMDMRVRSRVLWVVLSLLKLWP